MTIRHLMCLPDLYACIPIAYICWVERDHKTKGLRSSRIGPPPHKSSSKWFPRGWPLAGKPDLGLRRLFLYSLPRPPTQQRCMAHCGIFWNLYKVSIHHRLPAQGFWRLQGLHSTGHGSPWSSTLAWPLSVPAKLPATLTHSEQMKKQAVPLGFRLLIQMPFHCILMVRFSFFLYFNESLDNFFCVYINIYNSKYKSLKQ